MKKRIGERKCWGWAVGGLGLIYLLFLVGCSGGRPENKVISPSLPSKTLLGSYQAYVTLNPPSISIEPVTTSNLTPQELADTDLIAIAFPFNIKGSLSLIESTATIAVTMTNTSSLSTLNSVDARIRWITDNGVTILGDTPCCPVPGDTVPGGYFFLGTVNPGNGMTTDSWVFQNVTMDYHFGFDMYGNSSINIFTNSGTSQAPNIASDFLGMTHIIWSDDTPGNWDIFYLSKPITGGTWTTPTNVSDDSGVSNSQNVTFDTLGNIHAVWQDDTSYIYKIYYSYKPQLGSWITPTSIFDPTYSSTFPSICADSANNVHVFWSEWLTSPVERNEIYYSWKSPSGSWSSPVNISNSSSSSYVARCVVDSKEGLHVLWENNSPGAYDIYYATKPFGGSWSAPVNISSNSGDSQAPVIARDFQDTLHAVWFDNSSGNNEILYASKPTDGTWSTPVNISLSFSESVSPAIGIDSTGRIHVVYSDNASGNYEIYYLTKPFGMSWSSPVNISYNAGQSTNPDIAVDILDKVHIVWEDTTPGNSDIFYTVLP